MIDLTMFAADHRCGCSPSLCPECNPVRSRFAVIRDYAAAHDLSAKQVRDLVAELPGVDGFASGFTHANVVNMKDYRRG